jgi:hypothetical protein
MLLLDDAARQYRLRRGDFPRRHAGPTLRKMYSENLANHAGDTCPAVERFLSVDA